jgi:hypothetical protein
LNYNLRKTPSLKAKLLDSEWFDLAWEKAAAQAVSETGLDVFPETCPWTADKILAPDFWPEPPRLSWWRLFGLSYAALAA